MSDTNTTKSSQPSKESNGEITLPFSLGTVLALIPFMVLSLIAAGIYFSGVIQMMLADEELKQCDHEAKAIEYLNWALLVNPNLANAYYKRAEARCRMGQNIDYSAAQRDIDAALKLRPDDYLFRSKKIDIDHDAKDYSKEIADCTAFINNPKEDYFKNDYRESRAQAYYIVSDFKNEKNDREEILKERSTTYKTFSKSKRAKQEVFLGKTDDAIRDYELARKEEPEQGDLNSLAALYINSGRPAQAIEIYTKIIELDHKNPATGYDADTAMQKRAIVYLRNHQYEKALADADALIATYPEMTVRQRFRAKVLDAMGCKSEAETQRKKALAGLTNDINKLTSGSDNDCKACAYSARAEHYEYEGQYQLALKDYLVALSVDPSSSALSACAQVYTKLGDYDNAIKYFEKAAKTKPYVSDLATIYNGLAQVHLAQHKPDLAIEDCTKCILLGLKDPQASHLRAIAYRGVGKNDLAKIDDAEAIGLEFSPLPDIN